MGGGMKPGNGRQSLERLAGKHSRKMLFVALGCGVLLFLQHALGGLHYEGLRYRSFERVDKFPRKLWQSWKVDALRFEDRDTERARTWTAKNPTYRYEVLTDDNAVNYVEDFYGPTGFNRPDIVHTYKTLQARIIQADLLRYLIMYAEGGVWADIDVEAVRSISKFVPKHYSERDVDMLVGIETDEPDFRDHPFLGAKAQSFCQWTFMCKPRLPVMMRLIENILIWLARLSEEQNKPLGELVLDFDEVLNGTGPSAFTTAILADMSASTGEKVTWDTFHGLEESKVVGRVLVLPSEAFAAGTGHSDSGNHGGRGALVKHHFHASTWTDHHPRFKHPIYGEVEKCNWDVECVKLWDANTAFFDSLSEQEQLKMISLKDLDDSKLAEAAAQVPVVAGPEIPVAVGAPPADAGADFGADAATPIEDLGPAVVDAPALGAGPV